MKWYLSKEAKRSRVMHLSKHFRLGIGFTKCGKAIGKDVSGNVHMYDPCLACRTELIREKAREATVADIEAIGAERTSGIMLCRKGDK